MNQIYSVHPAETPHQVYDVRQAVLFWSARLSVGSVRSSVALGGKPSQALTQLAAGEAVSGRSKITRRLHDVA